MSKELIERLRSNFPTTQAQWEAADRIEQLEAERDLHKAKFDAINKDFDALEADNARLKCCLLAAKGMIGRFDIIAILDRCLDTTPAQSLANYVLCHKEPVAWMHVQGDYEEPSVRKLDNDEARRGWEQYPLYRAMKEPE